MRQCVGRWVYFRLIVSHLTPPPTVLTRPSLLCACHRPRPDGVCLLALLILKKKKTFHVRTDDGQSEV